MKKVLWLVAVFVLINLPSGAAQVFYDITGAPSYVSYGGGEYTRSINNFGSNAAFLPSNAIEAGRRMRARRFARTYAETLAERNRMGYARPYNQPQVRTYQQRQNEVSRFDKNYRISSGKSYTRNGITYFD